MRPRSAIASGSAQTRVSFAKAPPDWRYRGRWHPSEPCGIVQWPQAPHPDGPADASGGARSSALPKPAAARFPPTSLARARTGDRTAARLWPVLCARPIDSQARAPDTGPAAHRRPGRRHRGHRELDHTRRPSGSGSWPSAPSATPLRCEPVPLGAEAVAAVGKGPTSDTPRRCWSLPSFERRWKGRTKRSFSAAGPSSSLLPDNSSAGFRLARHGGYPPDRAHTRPESAFLAAYRGSAAGVADRPDLPDPEVRPRACSQPEFDASRAPGWEPRGCTTIPRPRWPPGSRRWRLCSPESAFLAAYRGSAAGVADRPDLPDPEVRPRACSQPEFWIRQIGSI